MTALLMRLLLAAGSGSSARYGSRRLRRQNLYAYTLPGALHSARLGPSPKLEQRRLTAARGSPERAVWPQSGSRARRYAADVAEDDYTGSGDEPKAPASAPASRGPAEVHNRPKKRPVFDFFFGTGTRIGVTATIATSLLGIVVAVVLSETPSSVVNETVSGNPASVTAPPSSIQSASDLHQYVLSRPIWQTTPTTFSGSLDIAFEQQGDQGGPTVAAVESGAAVAYSVSELNSKGASLAGEPLYIVGRVISDIASPLNTSQWNAESEVDIVLAGPRGPDRVYALAGSGITQVQTGDVVYFRAVVAAVGTTTGGRPATYLIALDDPDVTTNATGGGNTVASLATQFGGHAAP